MKSVFCDHPVDEDLAFSLSRVELKDWRFVNYLVKSVHYGNYKAGWWTNLKTNTDADRNVGEMLCLAHSELSEAMEGHRKDLMDDKLPHRKMFAVELADTVIRLFDLAGAAGIPLGDVIFEKLTYNASRADHKPDARLAAGGKAY